MEYFKLVLVAAILIYLNIGCADPSRGSATGPKGDPGRSCSVYRASTNTIVVCPDGSRVLIPDGSEGPMGPVGQTGPSGADGSDGKDGQDGVNGSTGATGAAGSPGEAGAKGADGTVITTIKFCPNDNAHYPTEFPEYGLCINQQLFAVYSTNGGFLALIPPGLYKSDAVGSTCTFTVGSNCSISN